MTVSRRRGITAMTAAVALVAGTVVAVLPAAAEPDTEWIAAGDLTLSAAAGAVAYGSQQQTLATSGTCDLASSGADLLGLSGRIGTTAKKVGFKGGAIGVQESLTSWCNWVDTYSLKGPETLSLTLGSDLVNFAGRPLQAQQASIQVAVKRVWSTKAVVEATTRLGGVAQGTFTVSQGAGSCGATDGSVCTLAIPVGSRFDSVDLKAVKGAFGVVGTSTFGLVSEVDEALDCTNPSLTKDNATVTYLGNADGSECGQFGVTLTAGDEEIQFLKPLDIDPDAQFIFDVTWTQEPLGPEASVPTVKIDFENYPPGVTPFDTPMGFCPDELYNGGGALVGVVEASDLVALPDWRDDLDGKQYACVADPRNVTIAADAVTITDKIFLIGDAKMRLG